MLEFLINIFNYSGLIAIIAILIWLLLDITKMKEKMESMDIGLQIKIDSMRQELREDHDDSCAKLNRISDKLNDVSRHLKVPDERRKQPCSNRDDDLN